MQTTPAGKTDKNFYRFFRSLMIFLLIVGLLDFGIGNCLRYFFFKQESGLLYRSTFAMEKTTASVLILGSSRANHHYTPEVFEKRLHLSFYNAGRDGNFLFYHYAVLKSVLKRYKPKIVILDFRNAEFLKDKNKYDRLSSLLPYYRTHPEIRAIVELKSHYEKLKLLSSIYPFNSLLFTIAVGNTEFNKKRKEDIKGYVPLNNIWNRPIQKDTINLYPTDSLEIKIFESFVKDCVNANVKLYVICSPYFIDFQNSDYSIKIGKAIADQNNVTFLDYSRDSLFKNNPTLFSDMSHLNNEGAIKFSNIIVDKITNDMQLSSIRR
jgi:hypothetical protein